MSLPTIRAARTSDRDAVCDLLRAAELPLDGVPDDLAAFLVAERDARVVGAIGLEHYAEGALLRSAGSTTAERGRGVGEALVEALVRRAQQERVPQLVLLTTTAAEWFPRFGFQVIGRDAVPASIRQSVEFTSACPASATVMARAL